MAAEDIIKNSPADEDGESSGEGGLSGSEKKS
jgi:hypothetical protein